MKERLAEKWIRPLERFIFRTLEANGDKDGLDYLKAMIFSMLSFFINISIAPIMLYGAWLFYREGARIPAALEAALCILLLMVLNTGILKRYRKQVLTVVSFYLAGVFLVIYTGPSGAGMVTIVFSFVLALSFLTRLHNLILFVVNLFLILLLSLLLRTGLLDGFQIFYYKNTWLINIACLFLCIIALYYVWDSIISRLNFQLTALKLSEEKYRTIAGNTADIIWVLDLNAMRLTYISPSVERVRGYTPKGAMEQDVFQTMPQKYAVELQEQFQDALERMRVNSRAKPLISNLIQQYCSDGSLLWMEFSAQCRYNEKGVPEAVGVSRDVTERMLREEKIQFISTHDELTSLWNQNALRMFLYETNAQYLADSPYSFLVIDIDSFRIINESLGHRAGDQVLVRAAENIRTIVGTRGEIYRNNGDEFIVVIPETDSAAIHALCRELKKSLSDYIRIKNRQFFLTVSIGYCTGRPGFSIGDAVRNAQIALYVAKKHRNTIVAYHASMDKQQTREVLLEVDLYKALEENEFELHFQPVIEPGTGQINHAEALIRWNHPEFGMVSPAEFIPVAERTKLIIPMTRWVIEECCRKVSEWEALGISMHVSLNLSLVWFEQKQEDVLDFILNTMQTANISPSRIKLEITESVLMGDAEEVIRIFHAMRENGLMLALDDFGTGYSSFGYMKDLPLDILKLDRSLISAIHQERDRLIIQSMITIAHILELRVVAEGVETSEQFELLKGFGCDMIQGYYFSKPLTAVAFLEFCRAKGIH